jgi:hypothetical protein
MNTSDRIIQEKKLYIRGEMTGAKHDKNPKAREVLRSFCIQVPVYAVIAGAYILLVLRFSGQWLNHLFKENRVLYAVDALTLIVGQGYLSELLTRFILRVIKGKKEKQ